MKGSVLPITLLLSMILIGMGSCKKTSSPTNDNDINSLNIPTDFNFNTTKSIEIKVSDFETGVRYDIYTINSTTPDDIIYTSEDTTIVIDELNKLVASGFIGEDGEFTTLISVPTYHKYLFIMRGKNGVFHGENVEIEGNKVTYEFKSGSLKMALTDEDLIFSVNSASKEIHQINLATGQVSVVGTMPYKSIACAADKINNRIYVANNKSPFQLGYYDLNTNTFTVTGNFSWSFPRMDYNPDDGLLYISRNFNLYKVDPGTAQIIQTYTVIGAGNAGYCDVAFAPDGSLFWGDKVGLYSTEFAGDKIYATKISDNTLPQNITCLTVGSNGHLYTSVSNANGKIIDFDPGTGSWSYFPISGNIRINDFGIIRAIEPSTGDTDGDGVPDDQDDYPDDPYKAFNNYSPGKNSWATLAFEDLWPGKGDYDFNDLVMRYNFNQVTNASNKVVEIIGKFNPVHEGASFINGFTYQLPVQNSTIKSVTGTQLTGSYINLNSNGTEANQDLANIVVFDQTDSHIGQTLTVTVEFETPQLSTDVGTPPYNPYLVIDQRRDMEVHLADYAPTSLADVNVFGTQDDDSNPAIGRYYKSANNLPWAINIVYDFVWPLESKEITKGYLKFGQWAESGGDVFPDWYKDKEGYRDNNYLDNQ